MTDDSTVSVNAFLWSKWTEEEGGGVNKMEFTARRKLQEKTLKTWLNTYAYPIGNAKNNKVYEISSLEKAWEIISKQP